MHLVLWAWLGLGVVMAAATTPPLKQVAIEPASVIADVITSKIKLADLQATSVDKKRHASAVKINIEPARVIAAAITSKPKLPHLQATSVNKKGHTSKVKIDIGPSKVVKQSQTSRPIRSPGDLDHAIVEDEFHRHPEEPLVRPHHHHFLEDSKEDSMDVSREDSREDSHEHNYHHQHQPMPSSHHRVRHPHPHLVQQPGLGYPSHQGVPPSPPIGYGSVPDSLLYDEDYHHTADGNLHPHDWE